MKVGVLPPFITVNLFSYFRDNFQESLNRSCPGKVKLPQPLEPPKKK